MFLMFHHLAAPFGAPPAVLGVVIDQRNDFFASGSWHSRPTLNFQLLAADIQRTQLPHNEHLQKSGAQL
jgi:hypothetical protein